MRFSGRRTARIRARFHVTVVIVANQKPPQHILHQRNRKLARGFVSRGDRVRVVDPNRRVLNPLRDDIELLVPRGRGGGGGGFLEGRS